MNLKTAYEAAEKGDFLKCKDFGFAKGAGEFPKMTISLAISESWEIIPAEPKVLTVEEYDEKIKETSPRNGDCQRCWIQGNRHGFLQGHKNGRLERDLELRPLVKNVSELIDIFINKPMQNTTNLCHEIAVELKNIKPLKP